MAVIYIIDMFLPCLGDRNMLKYGTVNCRFRIMFLDIVTILQKCYKKIKKCKTILRNLENPYIRGFRDSITKRKKVKKWLSFQKNKTI